MKKTRRVCLTGYCNKQFVLIIKDICVRLVELSTMSDKKDSTATILDIVLRLKFIFCEGFSRIASSDSSELLSKRVHPSLRNAYKGAYGISSDWQFSPPKAWRGIELGTFDIKLNALQKFLVFL